MACVMTLGALAWGARGDAHRSSDLMLTARALGPVSLCASLDSAGTLIAPYVNGGVRATTFTGEDESRWPGRVATLAGGGTVDFESSWADSSRVWRASTTAREVRTTHGARVQDLVDNLPPESGPVAIEITEGQVVLRLAGNGVAALIDSGAERGMLAASEHDARPLVIPRGARIRRLVAAGDCRASAPR